MKILIVDDEINMTKAIARLLKKYETEVTVATDAFSTGEALARFQPDVITLDLNMPGLNGFAILSHCRTSDGRCCLCNEYGFSFFARKINHIGILPARKK